MAMRPLVIFLASISAASGDYTLQPCWNANGTCYRDDSNLAVDCKPISFD